MSTFTNRNNFMAPSGVRTDYFYYAIMATIVFKSISFIPVIQDMMQNRTSENIPYSTMFINLFATLVLVVIALLKGYYIQLIFFLIFFISIITIIVLKARFENYQ